MKKHLYFFLFCLAALTFTACGGDDEGSDKDNGGNGVNVNKNNTGVRELDNRYEIPHIIDRVNNTHLIRVVPTYGVNYVVEWANNKRAQRWTAYQLYNGNSGSNWNRNNWNQTEWGGDPFQPDPDLPAEIRTELEDYRGSGYTRGHIIPSADRLNSKEANEQTFYLSNMHPQKYAFNGAPGVWGEMENFLRSKWNNTSFRDVLYIVKGGTIRDGEIKEYVANGRLLVPQYFFMACVCQKGNSYRGIGFWSNHDQPSATVKSCIISIDELEAKTGIDFFCNLPDDIESQVERSVDKAYWKVN